MKKKFIPNVWNAVAGTTSYRIYVSEIPDGIFTNLSSQATFNGESCTIAISSGKKFYYVKTVN